MISMLIVEDNDFERESLKACINWEMVGIERVMLASNGQEGLDRIKNDNPDIVLTDIMMPQLTGLEMMERAKKMDCQAKFVFCSAFEDFEYVKQAMKNGASDYLLKPVNQKELIRTIRDVSNNIIDKKLSEDEKNRYEVRHNQFISIIRTNFLKDLILSSQLRKAQDIYLNMGDLYLNIHANYRIAVMEVFIEDDTSVDRYHFDKRLAEIIHKSSLRNNLECFFNNEGLLVAMIHSVKDEKESRDKVEEFQEIINTIKQEVSLKYFLGVSNISGDISKLNTLYSECKLILKKRIVLGYDKTEYFSESDIKERLAEPDTEETSHIIKEIIQKTLSGQEFNSLFIELENTLKLNNPNSMEGVQSSLIKLVNDLFTFDVKTSIKGDVNGSLFDIYKNIINARSIPGAIACARQVCEMVRDSLTISSGSKMDKLVEEVKDVIRKEYMMNITLSYLSKKVYLSSNYIRMIFKEKTGISILEFLTHVRIEKAKELLIHTEESISNISDKIGYPNSSYFHTVFKNQTDMTPADFRKRNRQSH